MSTHDEASPRSILERGAGVWEGPETMPPAPWAPDGVEATGRTEARLELDGRALVSDYRQEVAGETTLRAHTVIRWDAEDEAFTMHFFSEPGGGATRMRGRVEGNALVFEGEGPGGPMRQTFLYGADAMEVRSESPTQDGDLVMLFQGRYRRLEASATSPGRGSIAWHDLTVDDAPGVRDFYAAVVGWEPSEVPMGEYADFNMCRPGAGPVAGVCHARGENASLPPVWLMYVVVDDLDRAVEEAEARGGALATPIRHVGSDRMAVVRDPAGAALALWETGGA